VSSGDRPHCVHPPGGAHLHTMPDNGDVSLTSGPGCPYRSGPRPPERDAVRPAVVEYLQWAANGRYASATVRARRCYLREFAAWCAAAGITRLGALDRSRLESYRGELCRLQTAAGSPIGPGALTQRLLAVRGFLRWCATRRWVSPDWTEVLALPPRPQTLPVRVLTVRQVERVLQGPDVQTALGLRDRTMLEVLYATGLRRAEIAGLGVGDIDHERHTAWVRRGKGGRDRVVPLGLRAVTWVERYEAAARGHLARDPDPPWLFLTCRGNAWQPKHLGERVGFYLRQAGIGPRGSCHVFRHTMATLMFESGADIRCLQAILGHTRLTTTEVYTRVGIGHLCAIHARTHPGERSYQAGLTNCQFDCHGA
jgi:integrase/recombinase XerD